MTWVAAAVIGGSLITTIGTGIASSNASSAASRAAGLQSDAANHAADLQSAMYNQTRNDLLPFQNVGRGAVGYANSLVPGGLSTSNPAGNANFTSNGYGSLGMPPPTAPTGTYNPEDGSYSAGTAIAPDQGPDKVRSTLPQQVTGPNDTNVGGTPSGQSPFLSALQDNIPKLGVAAQNSLGSFLPGSGSNPLQSSLYSFVNGSSSTPNPLLNAANNSILGASISPNSTLSNLASFSDPTHNASLGALDNLLGIGSQDPAARQAALEATPGYQFTRDQGLKATQNGFAAQGLGSSGAAMKGAAQFATGLADQTYQSQLNNYLTNYNSQFNNAYNAYNTTTTNALNAFGQQSNLALNSYGQGFTNASNAYGQQFNNANTAYNGQLTNAQNLLTLGANAAAQTGSSGVQFANNAGNYLTSGAAAGAGGIVGAANALNNGITGITGTVGNLATTYGLNPSLFSSGGGSGGGGGSNALGATYAPAGGSIYGNVPGGSAFT